VRRPGSGRAHFCAERDPRATFPPSTVVSAFIRPSQVDSHQFGNRQSEVRIEARYITRRIVKVAFWAGFRQVA